MSRIAERINSISKERSSDRVTGWFYVGATALAVSVVDRLSDAKSMPVSAQIGVAGVAVAGIVIDRIQSR